MIGLDPMGNPSPRCVRANLGKVQIPADVKSLLYAYENDGVSDGTFSIDADYTPETKPLTDWLWDHAEVTMEYFHSKRGVFRRRFRLPLPQYRAVLRAMRSVPVEV